MFAPTCKASDGFSNRRRPPHATAALAFSELEDVLVAVDHRGSTVEIGLWMRATHLLLVDDEGQAEAAKHERHHAGPRFRGGHRNPSLVVGLEGLEPSINSV